MRPPHPGGGGAALLVALGAVLLPGVGCPAADDDTSPADDDAGDDDGADDDTGDDDTGDDDTGDDDTDHEDVPPPDDALFRTKWESFNQDWYAALYQGHIWVRPNELAGGSAEDWEWLGDTGLPEGNQLPNFGPPARIEELSVDGVHLMALSDEGVFYRGSDMTTDIQWSFTWTDRWGGIGADGPGLHAEWPTDHGWSVSDSHPFGVAWYEDPNGTQHSVGMGVAHLYRLGPEGYDIHFNDWWLPEDWSRQICGPERGTFRALNLSASASTMFLVGESGELYTRLYDFDTGGENSLLTYSYIIPGASGTTHKLPAEDWLRQPDIEDGRITRTITIFQNGQGNAARVLRVEGDHDGATGYFEKPIYGDSWTFVETGREIVQPFLNDPDDPAPTTPAPAPADFPLDGTLTLDGDHIEVHIADFNMVCSPAELTLSYLGQPVTVGGAPLVLQLHHVHTMVQTVRPVDFWDQGIPAFVQAALPIPDQLDQIDDPTARAFVTGLFAGKEVINFTGDALPDHLVLDEIPWTMPFRVPGEEKAFWSAFVLEAWGP